MQLFDQNGDEPWRNVLWIIAFAALGVFATVNYKSAVQREKIESQYAETVGQLTNAEEWVRISKKGGRETGRKNYFKIEYQYQVGNSSFSGNASQDNMPRSTMPVYYDPNNPKTHVLERYSSADAFGFLIIGGLLCFTSIP